MSRRHKDKPTITSHELKIVADEISDITISKLLCRVTGLKFADDAKTEKSRCSVTIGQLLDCAPTSFRKRMRNELSRIAYDGMKGSILDRLGIDIIDDVDEEPPMKVDKRKWNKRPVVGQLYDRFKDTDLIPILRDIYFENTHKVLEAAADMVDHMLCYLLAIYHMRGLERGLTAHYYRLLDEYYQGSGTKLPSLKTLQNKVNDFWELSRAKTKNFLKEAERKTLSYWNELKDMYYHGLEARLVPQYA